VSSAGAATASDRPLRSKFTISWYHSPEREGDAIGVDPKSHDQLVVVEVVDRLCFQQAGVGQRR
jgi:hypothetical protein